MSGNNLRIESEIEEFNTVYGTFKLILYSRSANPEKIFVPQHHLALELGDITSQENPLVEVKKHNFLGESLGYVGSNSAEKLHASMQSIQEKGSGLLTILKQQPSDVANEIRAIGLSQKSHIPIEEAYERIGYHPRSVDQAVATSILQDRGIISPQHYMPTGSNVSNGYGNLERAVSVNLKTDIGLFGTHLFVVNNGTVKHPGTEYHIALIKGDVRGQAGVLVRLQSECYLNESLTDRECDCRQQIQMALEMIQDKGEGVFIYSLGEDGKGIGLYNKMRAMVTIQKGGVANMYKAYPLIGFDPDVRDYTSRAEILKELGVEPPIAHLSNNRDKDRQLALQGISVIEVQFDSVINDDNYTSMEYKLRLAGQNIRGLQDFKINLPDKPI